MPSTRELRRRIKSVKNISQITRAMEMVAASRMRRAQQAVLAGRPYSRKLDEVIANLGARLKSIDSDYTHPLLQRRPVKNAGIILITSDKGLCGSMNSNVIRRTTRFMLDEGVAPAFSVVPVGRKGRDFMIRYGRPVVAEFVNYGDRPNAAYIIPIARVITDEYAAGRIDAVYIIYSEFVNTLIQKPVIVPILPFQPPETPTTGPQTEYIYEPSPAVVLSQLIPRYIEARIYQALLESIASEQSARLVAMRNATQSAKEMVSELTLSYNKLRQANITKELTEIASGAAALTG